PDGSVLQPARRGAEGTFRTGAAMRTPVFSNSGSTSVTDVAPTLDIRNHSATLPDGSRVLLDVSLSIAAGEVRALVGESGAGKSMIGKAVLGVLPRSVRVVQGTINLEGQFLDELSGAARRRLIGARAALIPQDPLTALNPSRRVGPQMTDRLVRTLGWP